MTTLSSSIHSDDNIRHLDQSSHSPKTGTGLTDSTHSSSNGSASTSSSAERYRLDEFDTSPILLYKYRGGLSTSSQKDLCAWLDKDPSHRVTRKPLPRYTSFLDIKRHDLYLPSERTAYADLPNYDSSLASVKVPMGAYLSRILGRGSYEDLFIVSPESSDLSAGSSPTSPVENTSN
ncbi:uncharacterized protein K489DRAFT_391224 [Dissoconium aciculare CBS 342.82]|uniref:Uncharacterized protein n=1 Tax=Dissoconium aciculare CBS 342.82 TaxID=1314786 RepID=A0A6J3LRN2_9PEZI|nr:uncharacterized protein K489DRAFT_391224 [Dissoconium aciculare CBS 342.82]KAF1818485.1 hypothetical protein K489DRAFT_391224 [Dissoconium aciculare CBS 342.82]